jgi:putative glutamine amidotransferase
MSRYLEGIDGLVIVGGDDVDPRLYGQQPDPRTKVIYPKRTAFETWLYRMGTQRRLPIFGICYGMQLINVLEGGTLIQHLAPGRGGARIEHEGKQTPTHQITVVQGTRLAAILGMRTARVVTGHHQAVDQLAPGFVVSAVAPDGVVEAIESPASRHVIAVQWHPEHKLRSRSTRKLFDAFVQGCARYRQAADRAAHA